MYIEFSKEREVDSTIQSIEQQNEQKMEALGMENEIEDKEEIWQIEIPKIDLIAPISEGTSQEVMAEYVGHFENTSLYEGNIGLAAHNRRISNKLFCKTKRIGFAEMK